MSDRLKSLFNESPTDGSSQVSDDIGNDKLRAVFNYHDETKHNFNRFAQSLGYLDWATQPDPFRRYADAPLLQLPFVEKDNTPPYFELFRSHKTPNAVSLESIGQFFEH